MNDLWSEVYGQKQAKEILEKLIVMRRVPHALIFSGKEGIGKFFTAIQFSKILYSNINHPKLDSILHSITNLQEPYIKLITPLPRGKNELTDDSAVDKLTKDQIENLKSELNQLSMNPYHKFELEGANTIKINSIRDIKKFLSSNYSDIPYRIILIYDAHEMNEQSQNALLKSLEEPPENTIFILLTNNLDSLLPTVQSRCWIINFEPLGEEEICSILFKYYNIEQDRSRLLSLFAEGSIHKAYSLNNKNFENTLESIISILRFSIAKRYYTAYIELIKLLEENSLSELQLIIRMVKMWISDIIKFRIGEKDYYYINYIDTLKKFTEKYTEIDMVSLYNKFDIIEGYCNNNLNLNVLSLNIIFELASISIRK